LKSLGYIFFGAIKHDAMRWVGIVEIATCNACTLYLHSP
jgi:hypothetical protein